jgi:hypothetical protein
MFYSTATPSEEFKSFCSSQTPVIKIIDNPVERNNLITYNNQNYEITIGELPYIRIDDIHYYKYEQATGINSSIKYIKNNDHFIISNI